MGSHSYRFPDQRTGIDAMQRQRQIGRLSADGSGRAYDLPPSHNRVELLAAYDSGVVSGTWTVRRIVGGTEGLPTLAVTAATLAYAAAGTRTVLEVPPGARIDCELSGYAGAGDAYLVCASWAEW